MKKSFTLIELLIVLVIIGIISILAAPQFELLVIKSHGAEAKRILGDLSKSLWGYYTEAGKFPPNGPILILPIPPQLDIKVPYRTKYFKYQYWTFIDQSVNNPLYAILRATDENAQQNGPNGAITVYGLRYDAHESCLDGMEVKKVDDTYYIGYFHKVKDGGTEITKPGWP